MKYRRALLGDNWYKDNTKLGKFILYRICYPIVNPLGLNRVFNLIRHKLGKYNEFPDSRCQWCGEKHN